MERAYEPQPTKQGSSNSRTQIVPGWIDAVPSRSMGEYLRALLRTIAGTGAFAMRRLFSPTRLKSSLNAIFIALILLACVSVFIGRQGWPGNSSGRLDAIELAVKRIETRLAAPGVSRTEAANPTTLLVAVQFVTAAAERSTPFETALAVSISMAGEHPKIGPLLDKLLVEAPAGVSSLEDLRREFQAKLANFVSDGLVTDMSGNTSSSSFHLSRLFGLADPEISADQQAILKKVAEDVASQNLSQAVSLINKLDGRVREGLEGWRETAQRRVAIDLVLAELRRAAFIDLIDEAL
jgi:hypothetical protein